MFTGIIEEIGTVVSLRREAAVARLALKAQRVREDLRPGDSLATNGVCLTVERLAPSHIELSLMAETLRRTTLGDLAPGMAVNLERALRLDSRLGGHLLAGHVDGIGQVRHVGGAGEARVLTISLPPELARFVATKGSIAVDGVSLTVVEAGEDEFTVSLVRFTLEATTLARLAPGARVNLEVDLLARYLDRLLASRDVGEGLTLARMHELGY